MIRLLLNSRFPMFVAWGPELRFLYNDAYVEILGTKHPAALGRPFQEVWSEIWDDVGPLAARAMKGEATFYENLPLTMLRNGFEEQTWFTFSYSPLHGDDGAVAGMFCACTETTAELVSKEALRESEARLRALTDNLPAGMVYQMVTGPGPGERRFLHVSASHERLTGLPAEDVLADAGAAYRLIHPDYREQVARAEMEAIRDGSVFDIEVPIIRTDGEIRWTRIISAPRMQPDGMRIWDGIQIDVTAQRRAVDDLRASEARIRLAQQVAGIGIWDWDVTTGQITWSLDMYRLLGLDPERHGADPYAGWLSVLHPDDREAADAAAQRAAAEGETFAIDFRVLHAETGQTRWVHSTGAVILGRDGRPVRVTGINLDITDERRSQEVLRERNETLEIAVAERTRERDRMWRLSHDLFAVFSNDGVILSANPAWTRILGWRPEEVEGRHHSELKDGEDHDPAGRGLTDLREGSAMPFLECRYRHRGGGHRWISWRAVQEDGLIYAVGRDVTVDKQRQTEIEVAHEQLRQAQKMEAVGQLTGGVAHDFNNLLTVIQSSTDLLKRPDLSEERRQRYVGAISDTVTRAAKLTGQLLAFARRQALKPEVFDVSLSVATVTDMVASLTGSRIRIEKRMPETPTFVDADPSQFDTAIVNMVINARDAMAGEGVITIGVATASSIPAMRLHSERRGDFVAVSISDTGSGIPAGNIERIFEPFFTTKGVGQGTGLGLSQVFGFVKQSGGEVSVESEIGKGTSFTLFLPRAFQERAADLNEAEPEAVVDGQGTGVLVVEDNIEVGKFATQALTELGYTATWVTNAEDALAELATDVHRFDVVFSDVVMPGMNGIDLAREIRRRHQDLPVVLASGYSHVIAQNGTFGFELLHKPYSVEQLSRVLGKAAIRQRRRRALSVA